ncbi:ribonuclease E inhibitor RraB [Rhizobium alvei]|uniref:Ribonuclease E inhibitor RraB n=1 Tax=Rhizobium alvei TaxID=1132659 RepID=A0ABT8YLZ1_9HYPH|nr:ribonuclease E inhibitor RraB [Rhizobium alvei]MDO6964756.1 ribonuclease E inhibitor RraB [Rhizobium alvei]
MTDGEDIPGDATGAALRRMLASGDRLTSPRNIDFSVIFPEESAAISFCEQVDREGFVPRYRKSDVDERLPWDVTATRHMVPRYGDIVAVEDHLQSLAEPLGGEIDGWGCFRIDEGQPE